jgi:hypothetical protein
MIGRLIARTGYGRIAAATLALAAAATGTGGLARAESNWIVVDARGAPVRAGERIAPGVALRLPEGARVTLIARTGRAITLRGLFEGAVPRIEGDQEDPRRALSALISAREERVRSIGVVRSGDGSERLPGPWLIDITRPGPRCLQENRVAAFWRPAGTRPSTLTIWPTDRSWRIDLDWPEEQDRVTIPDGVRPLEGQTLIAAHGDREHALGFTLIAPDIDEPVLLAAWMIEKGCVQQADALLETLRGPLDPQRRPPGPDAASPASR